MRCVLCGGELIEKMVTEEIIEDNNHIVVKVKAEVCEQCHERYYASGIVDKLIGIKEDLKKHQLPLHEIGKVFELFA